VTARLELDYRVNDDLLVYASYNRGSKSGGSRSRPARHSPISRPSRRSGTNAQFMNGIPFDPEVLMPSRSASSRRSSGTTSLRRERLLLRLRGLPAFVQLGYNQTVINLPATAYGLEAEINSHPVDGLTLQLGGSALSSNVEDIILPDSITEVEHDLPQAPSFSGNALARYEFALGGGLASVQADVQYTDDFCFTVPVRPGREGKGLHRPERAGRVRGRGRALGGRGLRRQPHRRGIPRVRVRQLAVCGCRCRRLREAADLRSAGNVPLRRGVLNTTVCRAVCAWRERASR
jgi:iron complex outermembrane receptor protein